MIASGKIPGTAVDKNSPVRRHHSPGSRSDPQRKHWGFGGASRWDGHSELQIIETDEVKVRAQEIANAVRDNPDARFFARKRGAC
jgi:hypothetical protein